MTLATEFGIRQMKREMKGAAKKPFNQAIHDTAKDAAKALVTAQFRADENVLKSVGSNAALEEIRRRIKADREASGGPQAQGESSETPRN
jgi:hypothetical protein